MRVTYTVAMDFTTKKKEVKDSNLLTAAWCRQRRGSSRRFRTRAVGALEREQGRLVSPLHAGVDSDGALGERPGRPSEGRHPVVSFGAELGPEPKIVERLKRQLRNQCE